LLARYNAFGPSSLGNRRRGNGAPPSVLTPALLDRLRARLRVWSEMSWVNSAGWFCSVI